MILNATYFCPYLPFFVYGTYVLAAHLLNGSRLVARGSPLPLQSHFDVNCDQLTNFMLPQANETDN